MQRLFLMHKWKEKWAVLIHVCCIFQPAFGCCALQALVKIVIFSVFAAKNLKKERNLNFNKKNSFFFKFAPERWSTVWFPKNELFHGFIYKKLKWKFYCARALLHRMDILYYRMDVPTLSMFLRSIFTVALVWNTGETGDINLHYSTFLEKFSGNRGGFRQRGLQRRVKHYADPAHRYNSGPDKSPGIFAHLPVILWH